jgi:hypothetical protein
LWNFDESDGIDDLDKHMDINVNMKSVILDFLMFFLMAYPAGLGHRLRDLFRQIQVEDSTKKNRDLMGG